MLKYLYEGCKTQECLIIIQKKIKQLFTYGNLEKAIELIDNNYLDLPAEFILNYKSRILIIWGKYQQAIEFCDKYIDEPNLLTFNAMCNKADALWRYGKFNQFVNLVYDAESIVFKLQDLTEKQKYMVYSKVKWLKAIYLRFIGDIDLSLEYLKESFVYAEKNRDTEFLTHLYNGFGLLYMDMGQYKLAELYLKQALNLKKQINMNYSLSVTYFNIGCVAEIIGNLQDAMQYFVKSLENAEFFKDIRHTALSLEHIGLLYEKLNDPEIALEYLNKSIKLRDKMGNLYYIAFTLFEIIRLIKTNNLNLPVDNYLNRLKQINEDNDNNVYSQLYRLAKATVDRYSDRIYQIYSAQQEFKNIMYEPIIKFNLTMYAILNWIELLINEYNLTNNEDIMSETIDIMNYLNNLPEQILSGIYGIEILILKSKLAMIKLDYEYAQKLLNHAYSIAKEKEYIIEERKIVDVYDKMLIDMDYLRYADNEDIIVPSKYLTGLVSKQVKIENKMEKPHSIIIFKENNIILTHLFGDEGINDDLLKNMIIAVEKFMGTTFSEKIQLERMKHGDYYIILKAFMKNYYICYIFYGDNSFIPAQKVDLIIRKLNENLFEKQNWKTEIIKIIDQIILNSD